MTFSIITTNCFKQTSLFENGTFELQYTYAEDLGDGRGWTCGICGFTEEDYAPFLEFFKLSDWRRKDFNLLWKSAARLERFKATQRKAAQSIYGQPAIDFCNAHGFVHEASLAVLYDTFVQHGESSFEDTYYMDSATYICRATEAEVKERNARYTKMGSPKTQPRIGEREFVGMLLNKRRHVLMEPKNRATREVWRESVDRIDELQKINSTGLFTWQRN
jgi:chitosanase